MSQRMDLQLRGEAFVNLTGRALKKDFTLKLGSTKANGKAVLGGRQYLSIIFSDFIKIILGMRNVMPLKV